MISFPILLYCNEKNKKMRGNFAPALTMVIVYQINNLVLSFHDSESK